MERTMSKRNDVSTPDHDTSVHELTDAELSEVTGGKPNPGSLSFTHLYDKATPIISWRA
jgi:bacteriocin-like protein